MHRMRACWVAAVLSLMVCGGCGGGGGDDVVEPTCTPEEKKCDGNDLVKCNSAGTEWVFYKECDKYCAGAECTDDAPLDVHTDSLTDAGMDIVVDLVADTAPDDTGADVPEVAPDTAMEVEADATGVDICQPSCDGMECGDDGCGGNCGECNDGWECGGDQQCFDTCAGKECGDDGYGGSCGTCGTCDECQDGQCGSVCWFDSTSGLIWQVTPTGGMVGGMVEDWSHAKAHCAGLSLDGGGWHLPTISELRTLIRGCPGTVTGGACTVTDSCLSCLSCWVQVACLSCTFGAGAADGCYWPDEMEGPCSPYWSSSPVEEWGDGAAWFVGFQYGLVDYDAVDYVFRVRCVR